MIYVDCRLDMYKTPLLGNSPRRSRKRGSHEAAPVSFWISLRRASRHGKALEWELDVPVVVVNLHVLAKELLLPLLVREVPAHLVAVLLGLEDGEEVDPRPVLLAGVLAVSALAAVLFCPRFDARAVGGGP